MMRMKRAVASTSDLSLIAFWHTHTHACMDTKMASSPGILFLLDDSADIISIQHQFLVLVQAVVFLSCLCSETKTKDLQVGEEGSGLTMQETEVQVPSQTSQGSSLFIHLIIWSELHLIEWNVTTIYWCLGLIIFGFYLYQDCISIAFSELSTLQYAVVCWQ